MRESETDSARTREPVPVRDEPREPEAEAASEEKSSHASPTSSTPNDSSSTLTPNATARPRDPHASTSPSLSTSSPSLGEVTHVTPPAVVTSPLGSVTLPMYEPDVRGAAREPVEGETGGARKTVQYTPLDAGELWSEFGGPEPSRPESSRTEPPQPAPASKPAQTPPTVAAPLPFTPPLAPPARVQPINATHARGKFEEGVAPSVMSRYRDGYRVARTTVMLGTLIKILGALLGLLVGFGAFALAVNTLGQGSRGGFMGLALGLFWGGATFAFFFVLGVILSSFGQLKKAALDSAVNSSPFLTNEERAEVMSLR